MRFLDKEATLSCDLGESRIEFVAEYVHVKRYYALTPSQKMKYLHNLLRDDLKRFYLDRVDNEVKNFIEAI